MPPPDSTVSVTSFLNARLRNTPLIPQRQVEKKTTGAEAGLQAAGARLSQLAARLEALESRAAFLALAAPHVPGLNGDLPLPAFTPGSSSSLIPGVSAPGFASPWGSQQQDEMAAQVAQLMRQMPVLVAENAELRQAAVRSAAAVEDLRAERAGERAAAARYACVCMNGAFSLCAACVRDLLP